MKGFTSEYKDNIVIYTLKNTACDTVDAWTAAFKSHLQTLSKMQPFYVIIDLSSDDLTPYLCQQAMHLIDMSKFRPGYLVMVLPTAFGQQVGTSLFARKQLRYTVEFAPTRNAALQRLREMSLSKCS